MSIFEKFTTSAVDPASEWLKKHPKFSIVVAVVLLLICAAVFVSPLLPDREATPVPQTIVDDHSVDVENSETGGNTTIITGSTGPINITTSTSDDNE